MTDDTGKKRILLADSDLLSAATTIGALKDDYHVVTARSAVEIFKMLDKQAIDMVVLETSFSDMDGYEVCRRIKAAESTSQLPVVFLSSTRTLSAEEQAFAAGAVEYIVKPFSAPSVKARLKNQLRLSRAMQELRQLHQLALDANPNTGLPGNTSILSELRRLVEEGEAAAVIYADLDNFKVYNDVYGFAQGDEIISFTANVIRVAMQQNGCADCFLGHIGGDDFVITLPAEKCSAVAEEIIRRIDLGIREFYSAEDFARGYVLASGREGVDRQHPLLSISMGAIDLSRRRVGSALEIVDVCTETKKFAKLQTGSQLVIDQRRAV